MTFFVILAIIFCWSAWVYSDAKSRNSSHPVLWAIGVFLLGIFIFPVYLVARPTKVNAPPPNRIQTLPKPGLCPHCGKYYEPPAKFCPNCGNKL